MDTLRRGGGRSVTARPPMRMTPPVTVSRPAISLRRVDLPQPDGPSTTSSLPSGAVKLTWSTAFTSPQDFVIFSSSICIRLPPPRSFSPPPNIRPSVRQADPLFRSRSFSSEKCVDIHLNGLLIDIPYSGINLH